MTDQTGYGLSWNLIDKFRKNFYASKKNQLAQNICTKLALNEVCASLTVKQELQHVFNHKLEKEGRPMTNQSNSGSCWIFAGLNCMRLPFMRKYGLNNYEFSQNYLYFWDKIERANYLLDAFVEAARKGEAYDGRLVSHLLHSPLEDGGQWDMLKNLVEKHGVMPKSCYPEAESGLRSCRLCKLLNNRLREYCMRLHSLVAKQASESEINTEKGVMMEEIHRIMGICLGIPPTKFTFQYYNKNEDIVNKCKTSRPITPLEFYKQYIKLKCFDMEDMVCIVNDPRPENPYDQLYTVDYLGNMTRGRKVLYINKPIEYLKHLTLKTLTQEKTPVWFGCDVMQSFYQKDGLMDLNALDHKLVFDVDTQAMTKSERLKYHESLMTHAMVFTAVDTQGDTDDDIGKPTKWRVENSWGDSNGDNGYLVMTDDWFSEYVYEIVVNKKLLDEETLQILDQEPKVLPAWDPMGEVIRPRRRPGAVGDDFAMRAPGALHHARFLASCLYILKLVLLSDVAPPDLLAPGMLNNLKRMAQYISLFHGPWFLQARVPTVALRLDLELWKHKGTHMYEDINAPVANTVRQSLLRHLWYLTEHLVILALFDELVTADEKEAIARELVNTTRQQQFVPGKPNFPTATLMAGENPTLEQFVGPKSWLLFELLGIRGGWLATPSDQWDRDPEFVGICEFVRKLEVVNDVAERGVKDIQDYANAANDGAHRGRIILVSNSHRFKLPGFTKHEMEENL